MMTKYTVHNRYLNTSTTVTVEGFDVCSLQEPIPRGIAASVSYCRNRWKVGDQAKLWPKIVDHPSIHPSIYFCSEDVAVPLSILF